MFTTWTDSCGSAVCDEGFMVNGRVRGKSGWKQKLGNTVWYQDLALPDTHLCRSVVDADAALPADRMFDRHGGGRPAARVSVQRHRLPGAGQILLSLRLPADRTDDGSLPARHELVATAAHLRRCHLLVCFFVCLFFSSAWMSVSKQTLKNARCALGITKWTHYITDTRVLWMKSNWKRC